LRRGEVLLVDPVEQLDGVADVIGGLVSSGLTGSNRCAMTWSGSSDRKQLGRTTMP
jgi:hypothetical protein